MKQLFKRIGHHFLQRDINATLKYSLYDFLQKKHSESSWVVFDIGAHHGGWAKGWLRRFPKDEVIMFEASPSKESILRLSGFRYFIKALGDKEEKKEFFDCGGTGGSFFKPRGFEQFKKPEYINVIPIDQLVLNEKLKRPEFIKMDVQGSESAILNGGKLVFGHASYLLTELSFDDYFNKDNPLIGHTLEVISSYGFVPLHIFEVQRRGHSDRISDPIAQLNILFGKPS